MRRIAVLLWLTVLVPVTASAVTVQEIVALSKSGVSDQVVLALIERDHTIFSLEPNEVVLLKREGVSEVVVLAMLRSGREQPLVPIQAALVPPMSDGPNVVIVGRGPDRPNSAHDSAATTIYALPGFPLWGYPYLATIAPGAGTPCPVLDATPTRASTTGIFFRNNRSATGTTGIFFQGRDGDTPRIDTPSPLNPHCTSR